MESVGTVRMHRACMAWLATCLACLLWSAAGCEDGVPQDGSEASGEKKADPPDEETDASSSANAGTKADEVDGPDEPATERQAVDDVLRKRASVAKNLE